MPAPQTPAPQDPPAPQPPPSDVRAAHIGAVSTRAAATIGAGAVLLSAVLSVLAGVVSANIAADAASDNIATQLTGETERSRAEYLRGQRQVAYVRVIRGYRRFQKLTDNWRGLDPGVGKVDPRVNAALDRVSDEALRLSDNNDLVKVIGSREASNTASVLNQKQLSLAIAIDAYRGAFDPEHGQSVDEAHQDVVDADKALYDAQLKFLAAARQDLVVTK